MACSGLVGQGSYVQVGTALVNMARHLAMQVDKQVSSKFIEFWQLADPCLTETRSVNAARLGDIPRACVSCDGTRLPFFGWRCSGRTPPHATGVGHDITGAEYRCAGLLGRSMLAYER